VLVESGAHSPNETAQFYLYRGLANERTGALDRAMADFHSAIEINPRFPEALIARGSTHATKAALDRAIADFDQALRFISESAKPDSLRAISYGMRGTIYELKGDYDRAIADLIRATEGNSPNPVFLVGLGLALGKQGRLEQAIPHFDRAIQINPKFTLAYIHRAEFYFALDANPARAFADLDRAIRIDSKDAAAYLARGALYLQLGDTRRAKKDQKRARRLEPSAVDPLILGANIASHVEDYREAIEQLNEAILLAPEDAAIHFERALAYLRYDDYEGGVVALTQAYRLDPTLEASGAQLVEPLLEKAKNFGKPKLGRD